MRTWPLARWILLLLTAGFLGLTIDLRVEHVDIVKHLAVGWVPILYSALMTLTSLAMLIWWNTTVRIIAILFFALGFIVAGLGFWLHNGGNLVRPMEYDVHAWTDASMRHPHGPPPNAPMAFAGLSLLGIVCCLPRFGRRPAEPL